LGEVNTSSLTKTFNESSPEGSGKTGSEPEIREPEISYTGIH